MKKIIVLFLTFLIFQSSPVLSDDTSLYGTITVSVKPNVLIIFDNSGSMDYGNGVNNRLYIAKQTIKNLLKNTNDVNFGIMKFSSNDHGGYLVEECKLSVPPSTNQTANDHYKNLVDAIDDMTASTNTPLAETLYEAKEYFSGSNNSYYRKKNYTSPITERCQKNYVIIMTDGKPTQDWTFPSYAPKDLNGNGKLDEIAKYLYDSDIQPNIGSGTFKKQNVITYTIGFQTNQSLLKNTAKNGGGEYFTANNAAQLNNAFESIMSNISSNNAVFTSPSVPVSQVNRITAGDYTYLALFKPQSKGEWIGNLKKYKLVGSTLKDKNGKSALDSDGALLDTAQSYWSSAADGPDVAKGGARSNLPNLSSRNIYVKKENSLEKISRYNFSAGNQDFIDKIKNYSLGDFIHSSPHVVHYKDNLGNVAYISILAGANDGMLHCFNNTNGEELWAYIPNSQVSRLTKLFDNYENDYFIDGQISEIFTNNKKIILFGERRGGSSYHAIDISNRSTPQFEYDINSSILGAGKETLGQSWCEPVSAVIDGNDTFILGGGYDNDNQDKPLNQLASSDSKGRAIFAVNADTGAVITDFKFSNDSNSVLTHSIVDISAVRDREMGLQAVYAGDLGGNVFAVRKTDDSNGNKVWTLKKLFSSSYYSTTSKRRKIMYAPDVADIKKTEYLFFGTGDRAHPNSKSTLYNRFYALKFDKAWESPSPLTSTNLVDVTDDELQMNDLTSTNELKEVENIKKGLEEKAGWFIDLASGEKVVSTPVVFKSVVYFTTFTPADDSVSSDDACEGNTNLGEGKLYALNAQTGEAIYKNYSNKTCDNNEGGYHVEDRFKKIGVGIPPAPRIIMQEKGAKLIIPKENGGIEIQTGLLGVEDNTTYYWKEIR